MIWEWAGNDDLTGMKVLLPRAYGEVLAEALEEFIFYCDFRISLECPFDQLR
jgi:hypothetical protein